ncbi:MAG: cytochrome c oxidase accessory protein CcoG [Betaproteobacteria bacterium]|nr:cytochrome c oxidase accessory protein CcoG [Betaproteobacteria bacterium]
MSSAQKVIPIHPAPDAASDQEQALYEVRKKIYPRAVSGWFAKWRWALVWFTQLIFYGAPWLSWNDRQAVLFDLGARKFYIFGIVFWPQDFIYLAVLLVISAYSLFLFTAVAGRLWCGYACPQTVYTEIFLWVERVIEGDRIAQMRLDASPLSARKFGLKSAKHGVWIAISLWTGFTFVGYFTPIQELTREVVSSSLGPWEAFWLFFYGFATYGNAGWLREQVCKYMCPYARFQGVMFDRDTLVIAYDEERGEQRGSRSKKADPKALGLGDCVDCEICVQVCPTGIDIRKGQQYECIGCTACIDGCDQVMDKMGYARGLIRYASLNGVSQHLGWREMIRRVFRPRVMIYTAVLWAIIIAAGLSLWNRVPVKVDVIRDRATLSREVGDGLIENVYRLQIMNTQEKARELKISATGVDGLQLTGLPSPLALEPASTRMYTVTLRAPVTSAQKGSNRIMFHIEPATAEDDFALQEKSIFFK